ncbi:MAG: acylphosphatase [Planctomycetota bacterium]
MARKRVRIRGEVQGVCFRTSAQEAAWRLDLLGWVRNRADPRLLELVVEGDDLSVETFVRWCQDGPPLARVETVEVEDEPLGEALKPFAILPTI